MKQDLEKAENAYLSSFTSKKSKTLPGATAAAHGDPNGKNDYQREVVRVMYVISTGILKVNCKEKKSLQKPPSTVNETFNTEFNINLRFCEAECSLLELDKQLVTSCILFEENSDKGVWEIDTAATSHFCNDKSLFLDLKPITNMKMSLATEDKSCPVEGIGTLRFRVIAVRTDGGLEFCNKDMDNFLTELGIKHEVTNSYTPEMNGVAERFNLTALDGIKTLLKSSEVPHKFWEKHYFVSLMRGIEFVTKTVTKLLSNNIQSKDSLTSRLVSKTSTETPSTSEKPGVSSDNHNLIPCTEVKWIRNIDLSEQQEALTVEVTIPNCYKQAIRSIDASKWHDAMDKEINVMMERKVWDLVDHTDNIKILENRWVYTIKYNENNKIVRYKARLVARGNTQLRGESFDEVFQEYKLELSKVKSLKLRCYSESDFATNRDDRVSMGGFITFIDETPIS
ncbi:retrovirus-related Pol polyprotein from transposon RE1 [Trichonephila clavipes]|nr:retrovirus-related Pol polyprotein from transposon RE1 [Trichonephila clavipes]